LSYRDITYVLRVVPCSHEAVRLWVKKLEQVTVNVEAKHRRMVLCVGCHRCRYA